MRLTRKRLQQSGHPGRLHRWKASLLGVGGLRVLAAVVGGYALNLSFAPTTLWWMAPVGLALLGLSVHGRRLRPALGLGLLFGLAFYLPLLNWTTVYVGPVATALAVAEALLTMPVGALIASASRRLPLWPIWAAAAWIAAEALRARFPFGGFPWGGIAYSQPDGPLLPAASLLGASGLAFLTALAGFALSGLARAVWNHRRHLRPMLLLAPVMLVAVPFVLGVVGLRTEQSGSDAPHKTIAVVQGNVPQPGLEFNARRRAVTDMHVKETQKLAAAVRAGTAPKPELVIWPENASDIDPYTNSDAFAEIDQAVRDIGVPTLVGAVVGAGQPGQSYNMGIVWDPVTGPAAKLSDQTYSKMHPVPFGEYMPWRSFFRIFSAKVDLQQGEFLPGRRPGNLTMNGVKIGDVICFEVVYDGIVRDVVKGGAQVLVVQTNNATFGYTNETYQQQAMSRVRAVEHGREVLISSTSGVSAVIRPDGSVESSIGLFTAGYMDASVPLISATTPGTVIGGPLEWVLAIGFLAGLAFVTVRERRRRNSGTGDSTGAESSPGPATA
ncbi:apolipoprotein N-acyltransferase [Nakamurella panacisegetis]|uniref:Apolipoprotein N-acyltransferase n=1 Tax=Nakamurella panacisegetis TaxID=1090615 RepID=A0A1H0RTM9_9ACTN|nr:apolipoprotein N-acyltransferase [Nakamurella panacisegetis]